MKYILLFVLFIGFNNSFGKDAKYPVNEIPENLKKNSNVVIRDAQTTFTIVAVDEARYKVRQAITILNEFGKSSAVGHIPYDKLSKIINFEGSVYNANGELVRKLKNSDIFDRSFVSGFSLYEDSRMQIADLQYGQYPYTVEFEYEVKYKYLFQIPTFKVFRGGKTSVQKTTFSIVFPVSLTPRYKAINVAENPLESDVASGIKSLTWDFKNIETIKPEPFGLSMEELVPKIMIAPSSFEYEGYTGKMDSWDNFGRWINSLNEGRGSLNEQTKSKVHELIAGLSTTDQKVKKLYEYLQSKTRYVNISLGIGGFQPFEASVVENTGYGDCKALSNFMVALLEEAGIKANYTLVMSGDNPPPLVQDFPSSQFNHVIVAVPNEIDTIWLECTSQTNPFGYMGSFTDNRLALMILEDGAKLVKTPFYDANINVQARSVDIYLNMEGEATASIQTAYSGLQYENNDLHFLLNRDDELKKWINNNTAIPSFDLKSFSSRNQKGLIPTAIVNLEVFIPRLASVNGKRLFLTPNLMNRNSFIPEANNDRKSDIIVKTGWTDYDTVRYHFPEQLYHEFIPEPVFIESSFGVYEAEYTMEAGKLVYTRKLKVLEGNFSPDKYDELTKFYQSVKRADEMKIVFLNKT